MSVPTGVLGVRDGVPIRFDVEAHDNYFADRESDGLSDAIRGMVFTLRPAEISQRRRAVHRKTTVPARGGLILKVNAVPAATGLRRRRPASS